MIALGDAAQVLEHRARLHQLDPVQNPLDVPLPRWRQFLIDARAFYAEDPGWAMLATDLGWHWWELLGADEVKPFARIDRAGLCWLMGGAVIEELDEQGAVLAFASGAVHTYPRKTIERVLAWSGNLTTPMDPAGLKAPWDLT
jgi:hypothetical protein